MTTKRLYCLCFLAFSLIGVSAQGIFEISPQFGYRWGGDLESETGDELSLRGDSSFGLALDFSPARDSDVKFELLWSRQETGVDFASMGKARSVDLTVDQFMFGGMLEQSQGRLHGHLTGLIGATVFNPEGGDKEVKFSLSIGGGLKYFLLKNLALRADLRGYCNIVESDSAFIYVGGVSVAHFSGSTLWQGEATAGFTLSF